MHITNQDFDETGYFALFQPVFHNPHSTADMKIFPGNNMESVFRMLGGDEPCDAPCTGDIDPYYHRRGPIRAILAPADFFTRLRTGKF